MKHVRLYLILMLAMMLPLTVWSQTGQQEVMSSTFAELYGIADDEEVISSVFKEWHAEENLLIADEEERHWQFYWPRAASNISIYPTVLQSGEVSEKCMMVSFACDAEMVLTSNFPILGKVKELIVRAASIKGVSLKDGDRTLSATVSGEGTFRDWTVDCGPGIEFNETSLSFLISAQASFFIKSVTIVIAKPKVLQGTTGELSWKVIRLPNITKIDLVDNHTETPNYRLVISGDGYMADYYAIHDTQTNETTFDTPWSSLKGITEVVLEEGVRNLGNYAFTGCTQLWNVSIPSTLEVLGYQCLANTDIKQINLPEGLEVMRSNALAWCNNLRSIRIPSSLKVIESEALACNNRLDSIVCYVNPNGLIWTDYQLSSNFKPDKGTLFLVKPEFLGDWQTLFKGLNVTFMALKENIEGSNPAGIDSMLSHHAGQWVGLNGCRLSGEPVCKGLYIRDGRKIVVR